MAGLQMLAGRPKPDLWSHGAPVDEEVIGSTLMSWSDTGHGV